MYICLMERKLFRVSKELCKCGHPKSQKAITCWKCRKKRLPRKCVVCGNEFEYKQSTNKKTCSKHCAYKLRGFKSGNTQSRKVIIKCQQCGGDKKVSPS